METQKDPKELQARDENDRGNGRAGGGRQGRGLGRNPQGGPGQVPEPPDRGRGPEVDRAPAGSPLAQGLQSPGLHTGKQSPAGHRKIRVRAAPRSLSCEKQGGTKVRQVHRSDGSLAHGTPRRGNLFGHDCQQGLGQYGLLLPPHGKSRCWSRTRRLRDLPVQGPRPGGHGIQRSELSRVFSGLSPQGPHPGLCRDRSPLLLEHRGQRRPPRTGQPGPPRTGRRRRPLLRGSPQWL
mmetsp:Transcript_4213/g.12081  ORF Transcript_4213/g.12081 Transcript_4213/m.12081 type:complete len:236 (+) Transcript_4213:805-1512(+)